MMAIYHWKPIKVFKKPFDDGAYISIRTMSKRKFSYVMIHVDLVKQLNSNAKAIQLFYDKKGYLGIKFLTDRNANDSYVLRKSSNIKYQVRSCIFDYFEDYKYFKENVKIEDDMAIIKIKLKDKKKYPLMEFEQKK